MSEGIGLQPIRDFVVQIRHIATDAIVGTGFVANEGIVTCAHVVRDAGVDPRALDGEVGVYYPEREGRQSVSRRGIVKGCFPEHDDDVVLLQIANGPSPLGPELAARLGSAQGSQDHDFRSFGYRRLNNYQGLPAYGKIIDFGDRPTDMRLRGEPLMLDSKHIDRGMSGAPVLDLQRNLIIGIIYLSWDSAGAVCDRDTGFAVDARVLSLEPLGLALQDKDHPKAPAPTPKIDIPAVCASVAPKQPALWNNAPPSLEEWVGRDDLLDEITSDWVNSEVRIAGLIGFGGEGKSSLARRWIDCLLVDKSLPQPDGVFWWRFYERPNVDEFFEATLNYLSGGDSRLQREFNSSGAKSHLIAAMLTKGRYIFILDGLEVLQHQDSDLYGSLRSSDLKAFLEFFASPVHDSFCLVTSCTPLMDMEKYTTYQHRDVDRLSPQDGRALLRRLGVQGKDAELDRVVEDWDGHALTLKLLASYLVIPRMRNVNIFNMIPKPAPEDTIYDQIYQLLKWYNQNISEEERSFMEAFSVFRTPIDKTAKLFQASPDDAVINDKVKHLLKLGILHYNIQTKLYSAHPLIRSYYYEILKQNKKKLKGEHRKALSYYIKPPKEMPFFTRTKESATLEELSPLIEMIYHECRSGLFDYGIDDLYRYRILDYLRYDLGAIDTAINLLLEFFPERDSSRDPLLSKPRDKAIILNDLGIGLESVGDMDQALLLIERSLEIHKGKDLWNSIIGYRNLSEIYQYVGSFDNALSAIRESLSLSRVAEWKSSEMIALAYIGWYLSLTGDLYGADQSFKEAEDLASHYRKDSQHLIFDMGVHHIDYLIRKKDFTKSRQIAVKNLKICIYENKLPEISRSYRTLGDLDALSGKKRRARANYDKAIRIARSITHRISLIENLIARGRWFARIQRDAFAAEEDLKEALGYAVRGNYRIYEVDSRIGLAWAFLVSGDNEKANAEAKLAKQMSESMGYHWGKVDANEILEQIAAAG